MRICHTGSCAHARMQGSCKDLRMQIDASPGRALGEKPRRLVVVWLWLSVGLLCFPAFPSPKAFLQRWQPSQQSQRLCTCYERPQLSSSFESILSVTLRATGWSPRTHGEQRRAARGLGILLLREYSTISISQQEGFLRALGPLSLQASRGGFSASARQDLTASEF